MVSAFGITRRGPVRPINEDSFAVERQLRLCVVADGMGGHNAGEVASRIAVETIIEEIAAGTGRSVWPYGFDPALSLASNQLRTAMHMANLRVAQASTRVRDYSGMGTTVVATLVGADNRLSIAHVGDSRVYLLAHDRLTCLTTDDAWIASAEASDFDINPGLLWRHPMRHTLTNVVGRGERTEVHVTESAVGSGDIVALTTDGVHDVVNDRWIARVIAGYRDVRRAAAALIDAALACDTRDDCTAVVAQF